MTNGGHTANQHHPSGEYEEQYRALQRSRDETLSRIAATLGPIMLKQLETMPIESYSDKQHVATWVNSQLRELGLAIRCPHTGRPAILVADLRDAETQSSRFRYAIRDKAGKPTKTISSKELPQFELMPDEPRRESRAKGPQPGHAANEL